MALIFISHSSNDLEIAEQFVDSLKALGVKDEDIFFSAKTHLGVGVGNRFPEVINNKFHQSTLVFLLLTKNYYSSYNCQQEEGAAWYTMKEKRIYPIRIGVSLDEMRGFIDKTVIASLPEANNLRDIPYVLKECGFINIIPEDKDQFDGFVKKCSEISIENVSETMGETISNNLHSQYTDEDYILLNYFRINKLPMVIWARDQKTKKLTIEEYSADYDGFDSDLRVDYFIKRGWITENYDGDESLDLHIFDEIISDKTFNDKIRIISERYKVKKESLEDIILNGNLSDSVKMMLIFIRDSKTEELGDRWMSEQTIDRIVEWENVACLDSVLSAHYYEVLDYMKENNWVYVKERTSYGNPRLFGINEKIIG